MSSHNGERGLVSFSSYKDINPTQQKPKDLQSHTPTSCKAAAGTWPLGVSGEAARASGGQARWAATPPCSLQSPMYQGILRDTPTEDILITKPNYCTAPGKCWEHLLKVFKHPNRSSWPCQRQVPKGTAGSSKEKKKHKNKTHSLSSTESG